MFSKPNNRAHSSKDRFSMRILNDILDSFFMEKDMEKVNKFGQIFHYLKGHGKTTWQMERAD